MEVSITFTYMVYLEQSTQVRILTASWTQEVIVIRHCQDMQWLGTRSCSLVGPVSMQWQLHLFQLFQHHSLVNLFIAEHILFSCIWKTIGIVYLHELSNAYNVLTSIAHHFCLYWIFLLGRGLCMFWWKRLYTFVENQASFREICTKLSLKCHIRFYMFYRRSEANVMCWLYQVSQHIFHRNLSSCYLLILLNSCKVAVLTQILVEVLI